MSSFEQREAERRAAREAARREARLEEERERRREEAREAEREEQRDAERREAARAEALAEARAAERRDARRAAARTAARTGRREATREQERAAERTAAARAERREEERAGERAAERLDAAREARRAAQRDQGAAAERTASARDARREEERDREAAAERTQAARDERREEERDREAAAHRTQAARDERREEERDQEAAAGRAEAARAERRDVARAEARGEEAAAERQEAARAERREEERAEAARAERREEARARRRDEARERGRVQRRRAAASGGQRVPAGARSGGLPWLRASQNGLVDESGSRVWLRGVVARALERAEPVGEEVAPALDADEAGVLAEWGATAVAVPVAQDLVLHGRGEATGEDVLRALDATVEAAAAAGLRTVIALGPLAAELPDHASLPDRESLDFWALVARRYAAEPAVCLELFAERREPGVDDSLAPLVPGFDRVLWRRWLLALLGEARRAHPRAPVILGAPDPRLFPLFHTDGSLVPNAVYATSLAAGDPDGMAVVERMARRAPAIASPWTVGDGRSVETTGRRLAAAGAHWLADGWPSAFVADAELRPTALGLALQTALGQPPPRSAWLAPRVGPVRVRG